MDTRTMFEKLGYTKMERLQDQMIYIRPNPDNSMAFDYRVVFTYATKTFTVADDWGDSYPITKELLEAIVYQCKDLGWF